MIRPLSRYFAQLCVDSYDEAKIAARGWRDRAADVEVLFDRAPWGVTFTWTGTEGFLDALRDVNAVPWYDPRIGWCHRGFLMGVLAIWPALQPALDQARQDKVPVYQAGHSLGGGEASIAAGLMVSVGHIPAGLFTIGAPRPAFGGLRRLLAAAGVPVRRYVGSGDPVPSVPSSAAETTFS